MSHWAKACEAVYRDVGDGPQLPSPNSALAWEFWAGFAIQVGRNNDIMLYIIIIK